MLCNIPKEQRYLSKLSSLPLKGQVSYLQTTSNTIWHSEDRTSWYILIIKDDEMPTSQIYFDKELYIFRTDLLSIIRSLNTVYTATGICHARYVHSLLADSQHI
jgi:hypothetical protein